jgi:hypothetical protein
MTSLAPHIEAFLREHLVRHRGASQHTCDSYAYSFQSLFEFASTRLESGSFGPDAGAVGRNSGQQIPGTSGDHTGQLCGEPIRRARSLDQVARQSRPAWIIRISS